MKNFKIVKNEIVAKREDVKKYADFCVAVEFEKYSMDISRLTDEISSIEKALKISADTTKKKVLTPEEVEAKKARKAEAEAEKAEAEKNAKKAESIHNKVVNAITSAKNDETGGTNRKESVQNVLRVLACGDDKKLQKYVISEKFEDEKSFKENMDKVVDCSKSLDDEGVLRNTQTRNKARKEANKKIKSFVKQAFSIPVENDYTNAIVVNLKADDLALLHQCYVTGVENKFDSDDDGVSYEGRKIKTLFGDNLKKTLMVLVTRQYFA